MSKIIALKKLIDSHFEKLEELVKYNNNDNNKTFYIYTTGIADWNGSFDGSMILEIWKNCRYKNIINQIPEQFNNIIIEHYDPLIDPTTKKKYTDTQQIEEQINEVINKQDSEAQKILNKQTKQTFIKNFLNFANIEKITKNKHYIILDFAHILNYFYNDDNIYYIREEKESLKEKKEVEEEKKDDKYSNKYYNKRYYFNCIHIQYPSIANYYEDIKYFNYDIKSKKITSYIELFLRTLLDINNVKVLEQLFIFDKYDEKNEIIDFNTIKIIDFNTILDNELLIKILYMNGFNQYIQKQTQENKTKMYKYIDTNNIKNKLFIEFFEKLFNKETNIFDIKKYKIFIEFQKLFNKETNIFDI